MNGAHYAIVWVTHAEAKVYRFNADRESEADVHSHTSLQRLHHRPTGWEAGGNPPDDTEFFARVHGALENAEQIVITGPGNAKLALKMFLDHLRPLVESQILVVEALDDRPDTLLAIARRHFDKTVAT